MPEEHSVTGSIPVGGTSAGVIQWLGYSPDKRVSIGSNPISCTLPTNSKRIYLYNILKMHSSDVCNKRRQTRPVYLDSTIKEQYEF